MTEQRQSIKHLLSALEHELRKEDLWQGMPPAPEAFDSQVPFFADQMNFTEWLQWVFIARFHALIAGGHPLPEKCSIAPMAEEALSGTPNVTTVIDILVRIDSLVEQD